MYLFMDTGPFYHLNNMFALIHWNFNHTCVVEKTSNQDRPFIDESIHIHQIQPSIFFCLDLVIFKYHYICMGRWSIFSNYQAL